MIRGRSVLLRPVEERDWPLVQRWQNDPEVWWLMDYEGPFSMADIEASEQRAREEGVPFTIDLDGRAIGRIGLNQFRRRDRIATLYVFIGEPDAWGRGYGTDAIFALLEWTFDRHDLHQVELWSLADNERALKAYERCGFVVDGRLRDRSFKDGGWHDRIVMSVTRQEFSKALEAYCSATM